MRTLSKKTILSFSCMFSIALRSSTEVIEYLHSSEKQIKKTVFLLEKIRQKPKKNDNLKTVTELQDYLKAYCFNHKTDQEKIYKELNLFLKNLLRECRTNFSDSLLLTQDSLTDTKKPS